MPNNGRSTEEDIAIGVLWVLSAEPGGEATFRTLINKIPNHVALTPQDRVRSTTRPNEEMWEQQVRNITSHHASPGNYIYEGYVERIDDGLRLTDLGRQHLESRGPKNTAPYSPA
jgi:hypothetical protein